MLVVRIATVYLLLWLARVLAHHFMTYTIFTPMMKKMSLSGDLSRATLLMSGQARIHIGICLLLTLFLFYF